MSRSAATCVVRVRSAGQADGELMNFQSRLSNKWVVRHVRLGRTLSSGELGLGETGKQADQCGGTRTNSAHRLGVPARRCETREGTEQSEKRH
jgi:hypothetical protein